MGVSTKFGLIYFEAAEDKFMKAKLSREQNFMFSFTTFSSIQDLLKRTPSTQISPRGKQEVRRTYIFRHLTLTKLDFN